MKAASYLYKDSNFSLCADPDHLPPEQVQLVLGFGSRDLLAEKSLPDFFWLCIYLSIDWFFEI